MSQPVAVVTGASSGIGRAIGQILARQGYIVAAIGRNESALKKAGQEFPSEIWQTFVTDLSQPAAIATLCHQLSETFHDRIEILVNAAGLAHLGATLDVPMAAYQESLSVNCLAPIQITQALIQRGLRRGGKIVNLVSGVGHRGLPEVSPYCLSKAAFMSWTESLRLELRPLGIQVFSISPGLVATEFQTRAVAHGSINNSFGQGSSLSAEQVAKDTWNALQSGRTRVELSLRGRIAAILNALAPRFLDHLLSRSVAAQKNSTLPLSSSLTPRKEDL